MTYYIPRNRKNGDLRYRNQRAVDPLRGDSVGKLRDAGALSEARLSTRGEICAIGEESFAQDWVVWVNT